LVLALLASARIGITALVVLTSLSISVQAGVVLAVTRVLACLPWARGSRSRVRWAVLGIRIRIQLEAVARAELALHVVARQAWERDAANWRAGSVTLAGVVWLRANVGVGWDWDAGGG
jgi:hypothetical protein